MLRLALRIGLACIVYLGTTSASSNLTSSSVSSIEIHSSFQGLPGEPIRDDLNIVRNGENFSVNGRIVPNEKIATLVWAVSRATRSIPLPDDFGITNGWLGATADRAFASYVNIGAGTGDSGFYTAAQRRFYVTSYKNMSTVSAALGSYYAQNFEIADDDPDVTVIINLSGGGAITVHSDRRAMLMLPWTITQTETSRVTYDPAVTGAISALLPTSDPNYSLLSRNTFLGEVPFLVGGEIAQGWGKLPKYNVTPLISALERRYNVHLSADYNTGAGGTFEMTMSGQDNMLAPFRPLEWVAKLWWDDSLPNVGATVRLPIGNNAIHNTGVIPAARNFMLIATSIPWVQRVMRANPNVKLTIDVENGGGSSMPERQQASFLADMVTLGRQGVIPDMQRQLQGAFEVMFDESEHNTFSSWVIFPDRNAILWSYYDAPILDLGDTVIAKPCKRRDMDKCSGLLRKPDGTIVP